MVIEAPFIVGDGMSNALLSAAAAARKYRTKHPDRVKETCRRYRAKNSEKRRSIELSWCVRNPEHYLWTNARKRAAKHGIPFSISPADIVIPKVCPWLGVTLDPPRSGRRSNSPSIDRIDNSKGYEPGNVEVISSRANCLKSDCSLQELIKLGEVAKQRLGE